MFCQSMLSIALELAAHDPGYEQIADKFLEHFLWIAGAMNPEGKNENELWDEEDGFFYDVLNMPDGTACRLKLKSMVGLLPMCAMTVIPGEILEKYPRLMKRVRNFFERRPELAANLHDPSVPGERGRGLLSVLNDRNLVRVLTRMLDEKQFLGEYGIRSISKEHKDKPYVFDMNGTEYKVEYEPAESSTGLFGGNSNWRGPVWMPVNALIIRTLLLLYQYYGDSLKMECPTDRVCRRICLRLREISRSGWVISSDAIKEDIGRFSEIRRSFRRTRIGVIIYSFMNTSMGTMGRGLGQVIRRGGRGWWRDLSSCWIT